MKWVAFFSQTGTELADIIHYSGKKPDFIFTNQKDLSKIDKRLLDFTIVYFKTFDQLRRVKHLYRDAVVTLHGFLRIIPEDLIVDNMFNGHPGLITKFPELKGFNPQEKAFELQHTVGGSVIHKVIPEVDAGEVLYEKEISLVDLDLDSVYNALKDCSLELWLEFMRGLECD